MIPREARVDSAFAAKDSRRPRTAPTWTIFRNAQVTEPESRGSPLPPAVQNRAVRGDAKPSSVCPVFAEADVMRSIQAQPGVVSARISAPRSMRGGASDQNLFLFDNGAVYL